MTEETVEANLGILNENYRLPFIPELLDRKINGAERETLGAEEVERFEAEFLKLRERLVDAAAKTALPEAAIARPALNDLLIRIRMKS
jgi:hypothetical protein